MAHGFPVISSGLRFRVQGFDANRGMPNPYTLTRQAFCLQLLSTT